MCTQSRYMLTARIAAINESLRPSCWNTKARERTRRASPGCVRGTDRYNADSMAETTSGESGVIRGLNRASTVPSLPTRNFSKFHRMSPV